MKSLWTRLLVVAGAVVALGRIDAAIVGKERLRREGQTVYLPLAPVDPRSLMQGDYMALRFALARDLETAEDRAGRTAREGRTHQARIVLDRARVAHLAEAGAPATLRMRYRLRGGRVWLGTNAFFFPEGSAGRYRAARYGEFRLDPESGEAMLVGLRDAELKAL